MPRMIDAYKVRIDRDDYDTYSDYITALDAVREAPTVDAKPVRHGKWMGTVCTACGESTSFYYDCDYCPKCGARMDEE